MRNSITSKLDSLPTGHSYHIMSMLLPLEGKGHFMLFSVYAPTLLADPAVKDIFYSDLRRLLNNTPEDYKVVILGDFNARVGKDSEARQGVLGRHGVGNCNDKGHLLLEFCAEHQLTITNTIGSLSKPRRRRQRERHQTKGLMSRTMAVHVRFNSWYISLPSSAKQQREMTKFCGVYETWTTPVFRISIWNLTPAPHM